MHASAQNQETIARLFPGGEHTLSHLSDDDLLTSTRRLVGATNKLFAQLLLHLAEVETRGVHRTRACSSLYTYCIYELRMSEDAAARRSSAARLVKRFPLLFHAIAAGELHLTGLLMLGPHLTPENHVELLARAKFRTKKELTKLVRELSPLPLVPDLMVPLGPAPARPLRGPTWEEWVRSLCPPVRDLKPTWGHADPSTRVGDALGDWANDTASGVTAEAVLEAGNHAAPLVGTQPQSSTEPPSSTGDTTEAEETFASPAQCELLPITAPQQYQMQFSTTEEHVRLVERAKALLARSSPSVSLGELHRQALLLLVEKLEKERFAATARSPKAKRQVPSGQAAPAKPGHSELREATPRQRGGVDSMGATPRQRGGVDSAGATTRPPRQRGRHIPAAVRREVFARDAGCCNYVDGRGRRCGETRYLELHHLKAFAQGGEHVASNLTLRCAAHNALAAEAGFGRSVIEQKRHATGHDSLSAQSARAAPLTRL